MGPNPRPSFDASTRPNYAPTPRPSFAPSSKDPLRPTYNPNTKPKYEPQSEPRNGFTPRPAYGYQGSGSDSTRKDQRDADPELPTSQPHSSNEATDIKSKSNHSEPTKPFIYCIFFVNLIVFTLLKP